MTTPQTYTLHTLSLQRALCNFMQAAIIQSLYVMGSLNPYTTEKNNSHFRLQWGPLDPAISFTLISLPGHFRFHFYSSRNVVPGPMDPAW